MRRITKLEAELKELGRTRAPAAQEREPQRPRRGHDRRLHQRRQVDAAQPPHRRRRAGRGPPVRHARSDDPPPVAARRRAGAAHRHGRLRAPPAPRAGRGVQEHARGRHRRRLPRPRRRRQRRRSRGPDRRGARGARRDRRRRRCPSCWCSTRPTWRRRSAKRLVDDHEGSVAISARHRRGHRRPPAHARRPPALADGTVVELLVPYDRGDVLAAVHREGEVRVDDGRAGTRCACGPGSSGAVGRAAAPSSSSPRERHGGRAVELTVPHG